MSLPVVVSDVGRLGQCVPKTNIATDSLRGDLPVGDPAIGNCSIVLPLSSSSITTNSTTASQFSITSTNITSIINIPQTHYKTIVEFYLLRLGNWDTTDRIDVYFNDLLMMSKNYSNYGTKICSGVSSVGGLLGTSLLYQNQTDMLSY